MWVKFWYEGNCGSGINPRTEMYEWVSGTEDDETLKECADEAVPHWQKMSERGYKYGFERLEQLPEKARIALVKRYVRERTHAEAMLERLRDTSD